MFVDLCAVRIVGPDIACRELCYRLEQRQIPVFPTFAGTCILAGHAQAVATIVAEINADASLATPPRRWPDGAPLRVTLRPRRGLLPGTERPLSSPPTCPGVHTRE